MGSGLGLRELGNTGLKVSPLGFGASPLGGVFGPVTEEVAIASVHEAARLGVNFFDVSPYYGNTLAEQRLGKALKNIPLRRDQYVLSTKCGRYFDTFDFSADRVTISVEESLKRLNVDYLDIIHCHDIEFGSLDQIISETIPALLKLKEAGKVKFIGITGLPLMIFNYVLDRVPPGAVNVILSYCHYSLNDDLLLRSLPYLKSKGAGVISASPLSMGLLTDQGPPEWHPAPQKLKARKCQALISGRQLASISHKVTRSSPLLWNQRSSLMKTNAKSACAAAAALCGSKGKSISKVALQYSLSNPDIAVTVVGMCSVDQVQKNVQAVVEILDSKVHDAELFDEIKDILQPVKNMIWSSGREENNLPLSPS